MICATCGKDVFEIVDHNDEPTGIFVHESENFEGHLVRPVEKED